MLERVGLFVVVVVLRGSWGWLGWVWVGVIVVLGVVWKSVVYGENNDVVCGDWGFVDIV